MGGRLRGSCAIAALLVAAGLAQPASAETLTDALSEAYQYNPQLLAQRAQLQATDGMASHRAVHGHSRQAG